MPSPLILLVFLGYDYYRLWELTLYLILFKLPFDGFFLHSYLSFFSNPDAIYSIRDFFFACLIFPSLPDAIPFLIAYFHF